MRLIPEKLSFYPLAERVAAPYCLEKYYSDIVDPVKFYLSCPLFVVS